MLMKMLCCYSVFLMLNVYGQNGWKAGMSSVILTPEKPQGMAGFVFSKTQALMLYQKKCKNHACH